MNKYNLPSMKIFTLNLYSFMKYKNFKNLNDLSNYLSINLQTLKSWMYYYRTPSLYTLDKIGDMLCVATSDLIGKYIYFETEEFIENINNSSEMFSRNLRKQLNLHHITCASQFYIFFDNNFSEHTYYSYFKKKEPKIPSIKNIELMSLYLGIGAHNLIERF